MIYAVLVKYKNEIKPLVGTRTVVIDNSETNRGFAKGANLGIKQSLDKGAERVLLINPDAKISSRDILKLSTNIADIVSPVLKFKRNGLDVFDFGGKVNLIFGRTTHYENLKPDNIDYVSGACMLVKREVFEKIGFLDERFFLYFEDADFCLRAKAAGFTVTVDQDVVVQHNITEHRFSRDPFKIKKILESNLYFINKWIHWYFKPLAYTYWLVLATKLAILE